MSNYTLELLVSGSFFASFRYNRVMFIMGVLKWWYTSGWTGCVRELRGKFAATVDYFSIGLLLRTMFSLFRQDGAGRVQGSLATKIHAFFGRLISRVLGACIRSTVLVFGCLTLLLQAVVSLCVAVGWVLLPLLPLAGFVISLTGWVG